jgi:hypothetical protein
MAALLFVDPLDALALTGDMRRPNSRRALFVVLNRLSPPGFEVCPGLKNVSVEPRLPRLIVLPMAELRCLCSRSQIAVQLFAAIGQSGHSVLQLMNELNAFTDRQLLTHTAL